MKQRIYNGKTGWYIFGSNYKDKSDCAYLNLYFPKGTEPVNNGDYMEIDIQEAKFTAYKGKIGMTIFKYEPLTFIDLEHTEDDMKGINGIDPELITEEELPFY